MAKRTAAYGSWESPFPINLLVAGRVLLGESRFDSDGRALVWLESRPEEDGRQALVRWTDDGGPRDISPPGMNVRNRVQEYGGAPYLVAGDLVVVSDFETGHLHRVAADRTSEVITPDGEYRYADLQLDRHRNRLIAVREDHSAEGEAVTSIVAIPLDGSREVTVLVRGRTFYSSPRVSPDGSSLAYLTWDHPNLPWDGTELFVAPIDPAGGVGAGQLVAGSASDWIAQPAWSPGGVLHFVAEPKGWMNVQRWSDGRVESLAEMEAEFAFPDWVFGLQNYAFAEDGDVIAIGRSGGADRLYRLRAGALPRTVEVPFTEIGPIDVAGDSALLLSSGPRSFEALGLLDLRDGTWRTVRRSSADDFEPATVSEPEMVEFPTTGGRTAHGLFYRPVNPAFPAPAGERPPLIVTRHGGPTAQAFGGL